MTNLDTIVAVYSESPGPDIDWPRSKPPRRTGRRSKRRRRRASSISPMRPLVENRNGEALVLHRQSHHGWGKGAVVGAVVGILFPPTIIGAAVVGAGGGALVARFDGSLTTGKVKDLGRDPEGRGAGRSSSSRPTNPRNAMCNKLKSSNTTTIVPSTTVEEVQDVMRGGGA